MGRVFSKLSTALHSAIEKIVYTELSPKNLDPILDELFIELVECDIAFEVAEEVVSKLREKLLGLKVKRGEDKRELVKEAVKEVLVEFLTPDSQVDLEKLAKEKRERGEPLVILFVGPNGHGKTTTIAKMAKWFKDRGYIPVVAASDTYRAGAIEQIEEHAAKVGFSVIKHRYGADPAAVAYDAVAYARAGKAHVVLIDTAGRMQTDINLMEEMRKIARVVKPDLVIFVGDALTGNDAYDQAVKFNEAVGISASILTKADADVKGGAAVSIVYATKRPLLFLGVGQGYDDLKKFNVKEFVDRLLQPS